MKIIHSFNTRPLFVKVWGLDTPSRMFGMIWYYALSLAYARRLGIKAELHADSLGAALLAHLPYDNVYTSLDEISDELHPRIWAVGKAYALRHAELGDVHIDGDVFIKSERCARAIFESDWDVIAQYTEPEFFYTDMAKTLAPCAEHFASNGLDMQIPGAYNTGIVGFRNMAARDRYCAGWIDNALYLSRHHSKMFDDDEKLTPDLMLEQKYIAQVAREFGLKPMLLLDDFCDSMNALANKLGFQHVLTDVKFKEVDKCRETLRRVNPEMYNSTLKICRKY